jgi:hypothetical protein
MGPTSRKAVTEFQREIIGALSDIVQELRDTRALINNRLGGNALDHETFTNRIDATERRIYLVEREVAGLGAARPT